MRTLTLAAAVLTAGTVAAQDTDLSTMINESIGYVNIAPGIVLIEDDISSSVCKIDIADAFFFGYLNDDDAAMAGAQPEVICVRTPDIVADAASPDGATPFDVLIDTSINYENIAPGMIMIEGDVTNHICRVQIDDVYFLSVTSGDEARRGSARPTIICVPTDLIDP
ncbi:MAG: hypothetical protein AAFR35_04745 [Pseudomonadota bacterium]